ncbi:AraC family transcriptional regulator [Paenibacillus kobensis]|uniref:AraC family transcriptional regulator n=1 Tax=Paenibacillus kobensis TaxID=59841 RepID=UPI000FDC9455|nr:AraC family transcriptional regulator [Paenibacillus kobensis]
MSASSLPHSHIISVQRVVSYIEKHLDEELTIERLAAVGSFSPFHFHRLFYQVMNENVAGFIRRLRIEKASKLLVFHPDRTISDIALECGLQSPAHFARAFRELTGLSATEFRKRSNPGVLVGLFEQSYDDETGLQSERFQLLREKFMRMQVRLERLPEETVYYRRFIGTLDLSTRNNVELEDHFRYVEGWLKAREMADDERKYIGIVLDDPYVTPPGRHRYDACITASRDAAAESGVDRQTLPGGLYATVHLIERPEFICDLIYLMHIQWLPGSPYTWDNTRPSFEWLHEPDSWKDGEERVTFYLPVKAR